MNFILIANFTHSFFLNPKRSKLPHEKTSWPKRAGPKKTQKTFQNSGWWSTLPETNIFRTWKWMVGILLVVFFWGVSALFSGGRFLLLVSGSGKIIRFRRLWGKGNLRNSGAALGAVVPKKITKKVDWCGCSYYPPLSLTWFILKDDTKRNSSSRFRTWKVHDFQVSAVKLWECSCVVFGRLMLMVFEHGSAAKNVIWRRGHSFCIAIFRGWDPQQSGQVVSPLRLVAFYIWFPTQFFLGGISILHKPERMPKPINETQGFSFFVQQPSWTFSSRKVPWDHLGSWQQLLPGVPDRGVSRPQKSGKKSELWRCWKKPFLLKKKLPTFRLNFWLWTS